MSSSDKLKGMAPRLIQVPGYHIHPQYDMVHLRHLINERHHKKKGFTLMLAPMVDLFSILVIYLIMNFSTDGDMFFVAKDITIPKSSKGNALRSHPLISVVKDTIVFDTKDGSMTEKNDQAVPKFRSNLQRLKRIEISLNGEKGFVGQVNLQADEKTPVEDVKRVMRVLIEEGWTGVNFVIDPSKKIE